MIRVQELTKSYGAHAVLRGVTLEVARGELAVVIGASGSGKSTFLRCLNGLERLDGGAIEIAGTTLVPGLAPEEEERRANALRQEVGMVFQQFHLFPHMSALANIVEAPVHVAGVSPAEARERALHLLERFGLAAKARSRPDQLSGGEQQRVAIARALAMQPTVMLFDEPTSALDPRRAGEILRILDALADDGLTMVVVTHSMGFARKAADRVHVFHEGRVIESGPPEEVLVNPREAATRELLELG
ncbi:MAG: amino acid ABC transporter ATP-binding protein [Planctomycetes bacterium]|nr:amino acid ABC transporter ATP-binding protein [Planctomycetota bacterium]